MKLPKEVFVKVETDPRGVDEPWLSDDASIEACFGDDDGPTKIGVYRLVEVRTARRRVEILSAEKRIVCRSK